MSKDFFFWDRVLLHNPVWHVTHNPSALTSWVFQLQTHIPMPHINKACDHLKDYLLLETFGVYNLTLIKKSPWETCLLYLVTRIESLVHWQRHSYKDDGCLEQGEMSIKVVRVDTIFQHIMFDTLLRGYWNDYVFMSKSMPTTNLSLMKGDYYFKKCFKLRLSDRYSLYY